MKTSDFDYPLPTELIAQTPVEPRDHSRLMVLNRNEGSIVHRKFFEIVDYLRHGDILVFNNSRVIPARLSGRKVDSGGRVEILLLRRLNASAWETLVKPGKRVNVGTMIQIISNSVGGDEQEAEVLAEVTELRQGGIKIIKFSDETLLPRVGKIPLPPYIHVPLTDPERYQTVYGTVAGSVAAPTAGLHFSHRFLQSLQQSGVEVACLTLHVGLGTFLPVRTDDVTEHKMHAEDYSISAQTAEAVNHAHLEGRRIVAVGTTVTRALESAVCPQTGNIQAGAATTDIFIRPGYTFKIVDALLTNYHLPRSTLLMLVSAFAGKDFVLAAYQQAVKERFRFFSYGDCMLIQ